MDGIISSLEHQYCPPIDTSLFHALLLDHDVLDNDSLAKLREVLDALSQSASAEEAADFDGSGTSGHDTRRDDQDTSSACGNARSLPTRSGQSSTASDVTDLTEISGPLQDFCVDEMHQDTHLLSAPDVDWVELSLDQKTRLLQDMFPSIKGFDIHHILRTVQGDYGRAVEELLNHVFLEEDVDESGDRTLKKGIEGFAEANNFNRKARKKKKKGRNDDMHPRSPITGSLADRTTNQATSTTSRWARITEDIEFLASHIGVPQSAAASLYHKHGTSLSDTISALCRSVTSEPNEDLNIPESDLTNGLTDLSTDFPALKLSDRVALVKLTYPSSKKAHELALALVSAREHGSTPQIVPSYKPRTPSPPALSAASPLTRGHFADHTNERLIAARALASSQAASAYRASKSQHLMGGAAAYYGSVARDASSAMRNRQAAEADALVASQSGAGQLDLHGVTVQDALRITKERAHRWWETESGEWARKGKAQTQPFIVVTGRGQHSLGGKGRLGPAVAAMLLREGWKVEVGEGTISVTGRNRR